MWDSKYLVSIFPRRHCDQQSHNGNPDEEHMQLLSLNKISQFPLHSSTMGPSPGRWLSSYFLAATIATKPLPLTAITHFTPLLWLSLLSPPFQFSSLPPSLQSFFSQRGKSKDELTSLMIWSVSGYIYKGQFCLVSSLSLVLLVMTDFVKASWLWRAGFPCWVKSLRL